MELRLGNRVFGDDDLVVMAIINRTPDSFYNRGDTFAFEAALDRAEQAVAEGAAIVDIGGVKAGPGPDVDEAEEIARIGDFVAELRSRHPHLVISVDTWRSKTARMAVEAGADLINDTWENANQDLAEVAAASNVGLVCSHAGHMLPRTRPHRVAYADPLTDVIDTLIPQAKRAVDLGVDPHRILIDPAHDFGKNTRHSLTVTRRLNEIVETGWPVLVSLSNKDFIGETLDLPVYERLPGTLAATAVSAWLGARVFRAHEVRETRQVLDMVASIRGSRAPAVARRGLA